MSTPPRAAQGSRIWGDVVDSKTGEAVIGALVAVGSAETASDDSGQFSIDDLANGWLDVVVVADGYEPLVTRLRPGRVRLKLVSDGELGTGAELIRITAKREIAAPAQSYDVGGDVVRTLPGSGNDALKALQSLPGVSRVPFGLGGLVLRGFAPRDTNVFLDGIEVPVLYHFGGLASFIPSTMIESMELVPSGYGARYGRGQGGLVDVRS
ncbi:MAG: TonB-dependent receptor plug domain-containing protein, partial [Kofleriaceae bacterium]|nr:TonB-dependent receptor plug domain-containing protein [Kofleriaceae bacterium]